MSAAGTANFILSGFPRRLPALESANPPRSAKDGTMLSGVVSIVQRKTGLNFQIPHYGGPAEVTRTENIHSNL